MLVLLLLLLPVCFNRVLRKVLHELQGLFDLQQHFVCLTAPHLGERAEGERSKNDELKKYKDGQPLFFVDSTLTNLRTC